ncbi:MAG: hypothetical protein Q8M29_09210 [Bacteroidota bacterium]|nr:hypothetical protein [Bacteroidota bacterium]
MNKDNNIEDWKEGQENEFEVPKEYFESLPRKLFSKIELIEELKEFSVLSSIEKKNPFIAPENYFEARDFVKAAIESEKKKEAVIVKFSGFVKRYKLAIAAVFVMTMGTTVLYKMYNKGQIEKVDCSEIACLTKEDITNSKYFDQISIDELETVANGEMLDSMNTQLNNELLNEILSDPETANITDEDLGI